MSIRFRPSHQKSQTSPLTRVSAGLRPSQCSPSLDHCFDITTHSKHSLTWSATVAARRSYLF
ncbi:TrbM/KikA/MpfK family conjugal transfer protein [Allopusillimonas ginsengisoli]|uniref:TrbM/KikA/MpfK family conjugal transfer protein n=1 Tax=Allopusillimonas ginsengisoli TaxID=453575 RepID=UPI0039C14EE2